MKEHVRTQVRCDFCYATHVEWHATMEQIPLRALAWEFQICDSCRLLLRNVIGPVLHRLSHTDVVTAIVSAMSARGISYDDLMKPLLELNASVQVTNTEGEIVASYPDAGPACGYEGEHYHQPGVNPDCVGCMDFGGLDDN